MNWGLRIVLGLGAFMLFIIGSVIYMVSKNQDTLEDQDYYEKGLNYDEVYSLRENLQHDQAKPVMQLTKDSLTIRFMQAGNKGNMYWKRPSDGSLDHVVSFSTDSDVYSFSIASLLKGNWKLELRWENNGTDYISEHNVFIQ